MAWKQILTPNLDNDGKNPLYVYVNGQLLTDWYGWCLAVVAASFGAKGSSYSAKTAWQACTTKHKNRDIPEGMWIPLWYEGGEYGHVVIGHRTGNQLSIHSSPFTHTPSFYYIKGEMNYILDYIGKTYGVGSFSGWSETLLDSRIIEEVKETKPEPEPEPEPIEDNNGKDDDMKDEEPIHETQQLAGGILEESINSSLFEFSDRAKMIAYVFGDSLIIGALLVPSIISMIEAPNLETFGEYLAKALIELGTCILMVFKLIKKKS